MRKMFEESYNWDKIIHYLNKERECNSSLIQLPWKLKIKLTIMDILVLSLLIWEWQLSNLISEKIKNFYGKLKMDLHRKAQQKKIVHLTKTYGKINLS